MERTIIPFVACTAITIWLWIDYGWLVMLAATVMFLFGYFSRD